MSTANANMILQGCSIADVMEALRIVVKQELQQSIPHQQKEEKLLSAKETCKLFVPAISLTTLHAWTEKGLLIPHYLGGRKYYLQSEIIEAAKTLKPYSRK